MRSVTTVAMLLILLIISTPGWPQSISVIKLETQPVKSSLRGICTVSEEIVWASGSGGRWMRSLDGGESWEHGHVEGAKALDFRDIHAFSATVAVVLSAGSPCRIYKTTNGGEEWNLVFQDDRPEAFYNAMDFWDGKRGIAVGDPIDGNFTLVRTVDGGETWQMLKPEEIPPAKKGEAQFAASGTCLTVAQPSDVWFCTGGGAARVFHSSDAGTRWSASETPVAPLSAAQGLFSIAFKDLRNGIIAGGDYENPMVTSHNLLLTSDGGVTWSLPESRPGGYRSAVVFVDEKTVFAVGREGASLSLDGGRTWKDHPVSGYYAVSMAPGAKIGFLSGSEGKIARLIVP